MSDETSARPVMIEAARTVHFLGIGGVGMSGLAELLMARGKSVTGSDAKSSSIVERLRRKGARVSIGHAAESVHGADLVVATSAARGENPELVEARRLGIPVVKRSELLGWLVNPAYGLAVAGTHGKTTTTGMLAYILRKGGKDPTALIGGEPLDFDSNAVLGESRYLVTEADEFDRSFLQLFPRVAIITSIEADHLDCYDDLADIVRTFTHFASRVPRDGLLVTCADDRNLRDMNVAVPRESYGFARDANWRIRAAYPEPPFGTRFSFESPEGSAYECRLGLPGEHYALNALAAIAAARHVGVEPGVSVSVLETFRGTRRRFDLVGQSAGVTVVDDYAHHPTEVRETLRAARERHRGDIWCVFQPHTVNRTEKLKDEFSKAFGDADHLLLLPIYHPAGRREESGFGSANLLGMMSHPDARHVSDFGEAVSALSGEVSPGDLVITMGAGDVYQVAVDLLARLGE